MHSPAGSSGQGSLPASRRRRIAWPEAPAQVAEVARLAAVDVFAHAAGEHHAGDSLDGSSGSVRYRRLMRRGVGRASAATSASAIHSATRSSLRPRRVRPSFQSKPGALRELLAGGSRRVMRPSLDHDAAARRCGSPPSHDAAVLHERELGRAAADVDVEDGRCRSCDALAPRPSRRPRASTPCGGRRWRRRIRRPSRPARRRSPWRSRAAALRR